MTTNKNQVSSSLFNTKSALNLTITLQKLQTVQTQEQLTTLHLNPYLHSLK